MVYPAERLWVEAWAKQACRQEVAHICHGLCNPCARIGLVAIATGDLAR